MSERTSRLDLPLLVAGQGQKEITHNEALILLEWFAVPTVVGRTGAAPSGAVSGDAWLVTEGASGEWEGYAGKVALRWGEGWRYLDPPAGMSVYVQDEGLRVFRAGSAWQDETVLSGSQPVIEAPSGGSVVDQEARNSLNNLISALHEIGIFRSA